MYTTSRTKEAKSVRRVSLRLRTLVFERDNFTCLLCGHSAGQQYLDGQTVRLEADHIIPFKDDGPTELDNLQTLCSRCNAGKQAVIARGGMDEKVAVVVRLDQSLFEHLERKARANGVSVKELSKKA